MKYDNRLIAGILLFVGSIQWFLVIVLSEGLAPGYNGSIQYVSDLGVGPTAMVYDTSLVLFGVAIVVSAYLLYRALASRALSLLLGAVGVGAAGVGVFSIDFQPIHGIFQAIALVFGGIAAVYSFRFQRSPLCYVSIVLGVLSLGSGILFFPYLGLPMESTVRFLGLAKGSMERIVIYTLVVWLMGFGAYLLGSSAETAK
jgi:hypothetical membrane protein